MSSTALIIERFHFVGSAAQEAIKIISHQFVPFSNTFIYNAMSQTSASFQL